MMNFKELQEQMENFTTVKKETNPVEVRKMMMEALRQFRNGEDYQR